MYKAFLSNFECLIKYCENLNVNLTELLRNI